MAIAELPNECNRGRKSHAARRLTIELREASDRGAMRGAALIRMQLAVSRRTQIVVEEHLKTSFTFLIDISIGDSATYNDVVAFAYLELMFDIGRKSSVCIEDPASILDVGVWFEVKQCYVEMDAFILLQHELALERQVRAFDPWPVAYTISPALGQPGSDAGERLCIWPAGVVEFTGGAPPGRVLASGASGIDVATGRAALTSSLNPWRTSNQAQPISYDVCAQPLRVETHRASNPRG